MVNYGKKVAFIFTVLIMALSTTVLAYSDLDENHWAHEAVQMMHERGILNGYPDGTFKPQNNVTREEFAKIVVSTLELTEKEVSMKFEDIEDDRWSKEYIEIGGKHFTAYKSDGKYYFKPTEQSVREDVVVTTVYALGLKDSKYDLKILDQFSDKDLISPSLQKYIAIAVENGLIHGNANGTFNPQGKLTRAEVSQFMYNILVKLDEQKTEEEPEEEFEKIPIIDELEKPEDNEIKKDERLLAKVIDSDAANVHVGGNEICLDDGENDDIVLIKSEKVSEDLEFVVYTVTTNSRGQELFNLVSGLKTEDLNIDNKHEYVGETLDGRVFLLNNEIETDLDDEKWEKYEDYMFVMIDVFELVEEGQYEVDSFEVIEFGDISLKEGDRLVLRDNKDEEIMFIIRGMDKIKDEPIEKPILQNIIVKYDKTYVGTVEPIYTDITFVVNTPLTHYKASILKGNEICKEEEKASNNMLGVGVEAIKLEPSQNYIVKFTEIIDSKGNEYQDFTYTFKTTSGIEVAFYGVEAGVDTDGNVYNISLVNEEGSDVFEFAKNSEAEIKVKSDYNNGIDIAGTFVYVEINTEGKIEKLVEIAKFEKGNDTLNKVLVSNANIVYGEADNEFYEVKEFMLGSFDEKENAIVNDENAEEYINVNNNTILVNLVFDDKNDNKAANDEFIVEFAEGMDALESVRDEKVVVIYDAAVSIARAKYVIIWNDLSMKSETLEESDRKMAKVVKPDDANVLVGNGKICLDDGENDEIVLLKSQEVSEDLEFVVYTVTTNSRGQEIFNLVSGLETDDLNIDNNHEYVGETLDGRVFLLNNEIETDLDDEKWEKYENYMVIIVEVIESDDDEEQYEVDMFETVEFSELEIEEGDRLVLRETVNEEVIFVIRGMEKIKE